MTAELERLDPLENRVARGIGSLVVLFGAMALAVLLSGEGPRGALPTSLSIAAIVSTIPVGLWWLRRAGNSLSMPTWFVVYADVATATELMVIRRHELALFASVLFAVVGLYIAFYIQRRTMFAHAVFVNIVIVALGVLTYGEGRHDLAATIARTLIALTTVNSVIVFRAVIRSQMELANADSLTGLLNRRGFDLKFDRLLGSLPTGTAVALLVADLDQFKRVNDVHGHPVGDEVLVLTAVRLRQAIRGKACIARTGGEEFTIATTLESESIETVAENIRSAVNTASDSVPVTVSIGVSRLESNGSATEIEDIRAALIRADSAMYDAKRSGGNQISVG